ncbi:MAG: dTDP-4-dehydrorhamnose 3,5-epimerase [Dehalococcoidia bacterium]|jgi:dTDP-4-dehydrorhamnose 3,5-epimerase
MPFTFSRLKVPEVILIKPRVFSDDRGFFIETYKMPDFVDAGITDSFVQDNHSRSTRGVLRGLHYQNPPCAQGKLIRAVKGEIFDVAVDIRAGSPTYGRWVGEILSEENKSMLYIPQGFAHGFCILSEAADVVYKASGVYSPRAEAGIIWNDRDLNIKWPIKEPIVSDKDAQWPSLRDAVNKFEYDAGIT